MNDTELVHLLLGISSLLIPIAMLVGAILLKGKAPSVVFWLILVGAGGHLLCSVGFLLIPVFDSRELFTILRLGSVLFGGVFAVGFIYLAIYIGALKAERDGWGSPGPPRF